MFTLPKRSLSEIKEARARIEALKNEPALTKEQKKANWQAVLQQLRQTPPEKLSALAKWMLSQEEKGREEYVIDMRAVLK